MKKLLKFNTKPANIIAAIVFAIAGFYLVVNTTNPLYMGICGALFLATIHGALNGAAVGGIVSGGAILAGILYRAANVTLKIGKKWSPEKIAEKQAAFDAHMANLNKYMILYVLGAIALAFLGRYIYLRLANYKHENTHTGARKITYFGMFIALGVAVNSLRVGPLSFGGFPIIYSGMVMGPISGFIIGAITDVIAFLVRPSANAFNPLFILTSALTGAIPAFIIHVLPGENSKLKHNFWYVLLAFAIGQFSTSVVLVPLFRQMLFAHPFVATASAAALRQLWHVPLYAFLYMNTQKVVETQIDFTKVKEGKEEV